LLLYLDEVDQYEEEEGEGDLAPSVEDVIDDEANDDDEFSTMIKATSSAVKKTSPIAIGTGIIRKFDDIADEDDEEIHSNKRKCNIDRSPLKSIEDEKPDFDVFGFSG